MDPLEILTQNLQHSLSTRRTNTQPESLQVFKYEWAKSIYARAQQSPQVTLESNEINKGLKLAKKPIFVGGSPRSGTTFFRDLIDGHSRLCVVPIEIQYFEFQKHGLSHYQRESNFEALCLNWLEKLVDPMNHPPYWALTNGHPTVDRYIQFVRFSLAWGKVSLNLPKKGEYGDHVLPFVLGFSSLIGNGKIDPNYQFWLEKTPGLELYKNKLEEEFPEAQFIYLIRNPKNSLISVKSALINSIGRRQTSLKYFFKAAKRYQAVIKSCHDTNCSHIKFESFLIQRDQIIDTTLSKVGLSPEEINTKQTILGQSTFRNTSFEKTKRTDVKLNYKERILLAMISTDVNKQFDYEEEQLNPFLLFLLKPVFSTCFSIFYNWRKR